MCSINSQVLYNHNLHPSVHIDRIKWLQLWLKLTALHTNQGISPISHPTQNTQYTQYQIMVSVQWWVRLTFMPILLQFSWTLTTLHWSGLLNRQFKVGNNCQILHLDSMVHPFFCLRKREKLVLFENQFSITSVTFPRHTAVFCLRKLNNLLLFSIGVNFMNKLWYLLEHMRTDLWLEQIYTWWTDLWLNRSTSWGQIYRDFVDISQGWTCFCLLNWSNFPFISHCWCFAVFWLKI